MSLFYGFKKDTVETIGGLPTTGGEMKGDIDMGSNHILTSADPTENSHLARKKYVDDRVGSGGENFLPKTGGVMTGNIYMGNNIFSNVDPSSEKHLTRKEYVDAEDAKKLSLTGGTLTGDINMGTNDIIFASNYNPTHGVNAVNKTYVDYHIIDHVTDLKKDVSFSMFKDNFSLKFHNLFFVEYDSTYDLLFERN